MRGKPMNLLLFVGVLVLGMSCGKEEAENLIDDLDQSVNLEKTEILGLISGTYEKCLPSVLYSGYYSKITHSLVGEDVSKIETLSNASDCSNPYYEETHKYKISDARYFDETKKVFEIDAEWLSQEINFKHSYYISQNYCGYTDWALNVPKILSGVSCPTLLSYDSYHTAFKDVGSEEFLIYKIDGNVLSIPLGYDESGDSANERKNSQFGLIDKL